MFCGECGSKLDLKMQFCHNCGVPSPYAKVPSDKPAKNILVKKPETIEGEIVYFHEKGIKITNRRFVRSCIDPTRTIAIGQINTVETSSTKHQGSSNKLSLALFMGVTGLIGTYAITDSEGFAVVVCILFAMCGYWLGGVTKTTTSHWFQIETTSGRKHEYVSGVPHVSDGDEELINRMFEGLNQAIVENLK